MANAPRVSNAAAIAACNGVVDLIDGGAGAGKFRIYDGTQPAGPDTAISTQTLLAELTFSDPAFGNAADVNPGARATANAITADAAANNSGTASWFRFVDSSGTAVIDGSVGTASADLILDDVEITAGSEVSVTAFTVTMAES